MKQFPFLLFAAIVFFSCRNRESEGDRILREFDSVNNKLKDSLPKGVGGFKSIGSVFNSRQVTYDSIVNKLGNSEQAKRVKQMEFETGVFYEGIVKLKQEFYRACGDMTGTRLPAASEDKVAISNEFFQKEEATYLLSWLRDAKKSLVENARTDAIRKMAYDIGDLNEDKSFSTAEDWRNKYFKDVPPIAAITILNNFEWQVKNVEAAILMDYLKQ
jgi:hypothetical protein